MATPREALIALREMATDGRLEAVCERHQLSLFVIFGSTTDPAVPNPHDLDVAVRFDGRATSNVVDVATEIAALVKLDDVDVLDLGRADVVARSRALGARCEPLYERESGLFAVAQMAAFAEEMETAPMRRRDLELLARR